MVLIASTAILMVMAWPDVHSDDTDTCSVPDCEHYYHVSLDKVYDLRWEVGAIAQALYKGPLMRQGDRWGIANLKKSLDGEHIRVRRIQEIVRGHLYGESNEFRNLLARLEEEHGTQGASRRILESICEAFELTARSHKVVARDACLIANGKAHWVVTKMIVAFLEFRREKPKETGGDSHHTLTRWERFSVHSLPSGTLSSLWRTSMSLRSLRTARTSTARTSSDRAAQIPTAVEKRSEAAVVSPSTCALDSRRMMVPAPRKLTPMMIAWMMRIGSETMVLGSIAA
jgi:hypothetical protein